MGSALIALGVGVGALVLAAIAAAIRCLRQ